MKYRWNIENTSCKNLDKTWINLDEIYMKFRQKLETKFRQNLDKIQIKFRQNLELVRDWHTLKQFRQI